MKPRFTVEPEAFEGVRRIAVKVEADFAKVGEPDREYTVIFATLGRSPYVGGLIADGKFDPTLIEGKREVYQIKLLGEDTLLVCGSDKRGTIYGMFALSEYIGVSPLCFWGDAEPTRKIITFGSDVETVSKEPSVLYRGFFINDEWPCFGKWTFSRYGGFTCEMYEHVFELLLRLKGNYLWPAMWSSSFALDGPGQTSEELADIYGVIIGSSHHEPCLRASEEWDKVKGEDTPYGNAWDYRINRQGLLNYWEDGLKRSGKYEKIVTIGMRGERDAALEVPTLKENIDLLKEIIAEQKKLVDKHAPNAPLLLALYKEVEQYYYGGDGVAGLNEWDGLDNVICMFCEDNYGFMRSLPNKPGHYGMYYHFDYHGGPVSYEWMPSATFEKTAEQMSNAYGRGVRDAWIVNVGDLKFNEVPLSHFMALAYDYDAYKNCDYADIFVKKTFKANGEIHAKMKRALNGFLRINSLRRPEALNADTYHPCNYSEADRMLSYADEIDKANEEVYAQLTDPDKTAYYSMIYHPAKMSMNLLRMWLYAGKNRHYAEQGRAVTNSFAALVAFCIDMDKSLSEKFAHFNGGKWKGMELAQHIGFVSWNEDGCRYPFVISVHPFTKPRMSVSRNDDAQIARKAYGNPMRIEVGDFMYAGNKEVILEIANDGVGRVEYTVEGGAPWLKISAAKGKVHELEEVTLTKIKEADGEAKLLIRDSETTIEVIVKSRVIDVSELPPMTFLPNNGVVSMSAEHYCENGGFRLLENYGKSRAAMKVSAVGDYIKYRFLIEEDGDYIAQVRTAPTNPTAFGSPLMFTLNGETVTAVPADFKAGCHEDNRWCDGVLDNIRVTEVALTLEAGVREIEIGAVNESEGLILERIVIYKKGAPPKKSYLGVPSSYLKKTS